MSFLRDLLMEQVHRRHWQQILSHNFPEQLQVVLSLLLKGSESHNCSTVLWCDLINTLGQGILQLHPDTQMEEFRQQVLQYTTQQSMMDMNRVPFNHI